MDAHYILSDYIDRAMAQAEYDKLEDSSFAGRIDSCTGVIAFGVTLKECEDELRSTLEDRLLVGLKLGHSLPVVDGIDLNKEPEYEKHHDLLAAQCKPRIRPPVIVAGFDLINVRRENLQHSPDLATLQLALG